MPYIVFEDHNSTGTTSNKENDHPAKSQQIPNNDHHIGTLKSKPQAEPQGESSTSVYPIVKLDVEKIRDIVAGRLATSLLGHILYLKNQIPLPVLQLARLSTQKGNARAIKHRIELMSSFDTIASHLDTTFSALSTAFAKVAKRNQDVGTQAYMAILVGPSMTTAKSKVIFAIDGLEQQAWHESPKSRSITDDDERDDPEEEDVEVSDGEEDAGSEDDEGYDSAEQPEDSEDEAEEEEEDKESGSDDEDSREAPPPPESEYLSHAEEQRFLQNADRLFSRTLATADADSKGILTSEMSPTQTHVLIRAPRLFNHPAWIPRQNVTTSLDATLQEFLNGSGININPAPASSHKRTKKTPVEGVWLTCRDGISIPCAAELLHSEEADDKEDMIWWSWDGKIVGFSDW